MTTAELRKLLKEKAPSVYERVIAQSTLSDEEVNSEWEAVIPNYKKGEIKIYPPVPFTKKKTESSTSETNQEPGAEDFEQWMLEEEKKQKQI